MDDLDNIREEPLREILAMVFYRKEKNTLFDFIYNVWDTGALRKILDWCGKAEE